MDSTWIVKAAWEVATYYLSLDGFQKRIVIVIFLMLPMSLAANIGVWATRAARAEKTEARFQRGAPRQGRQKGCAFDMANRKKMIDSGNKLVITIFSAMADARVIGCLEEHGLSVLRDRFGLVYVPRGDYELARTQWREKNPSPGARRLFDRVFLPIGQDTTKRLLAEASRAARKG